MYAYSKRHVRVYRNVCNVIQFIIDILLLSYPFKADRNWKRFEMCRREWKPLILELSRKDGWKRVWNIGKCYLQYTLPVGWWTADPLSVKGKKILTVRANTSQEVRGRVQAEKDAGVMEGQVRGDSEANGKKYDKPSPKGGAWKKYSEEKGQMGED